MLALQGTQGTPPETDAALDVVNVTRDVTVPITPLPSTVSRFAVFANLTNDTTFAIGGVAVTVSAGPHGPTVEQTSSTNGSVTFVVPSLIPLSSGGYCVAATAPGYVNAQECGLTASALAALSTFRLTPALVPVTSSVVGVPTGTSVRVNLTAESPTAVDRNLDGGPRFSFSIPAGVYSITAYAATSHSTIVYAPARALAFRLPFGAPAASLNLPVLSEILAHGTLSLPSGTTAANTTVTLASSAQNVTVNGTKFLSGFRISVGAYTASVNASGSLGALSNLTGVAVNSGGTITPRLVLDRAGVHLAGSLQTTSGGSLSLNGTVTLRAPGGAVLHSKASGGHFTTLVPTEHNFSVAANITVRTTGPNGSYFLTWSVVSGTTCSVGTGAATCTVPMTSTKDPAWLNGTITESARSGPTPSQLRLIGPYPSTNLSVLTVANGTFALRLAPGSYFLYAAPLDGSPFAGFLTALALPGAAGPISLALASAATDQVTVASSGAAGQTIGAITLTATGFAGNRVVYSDLTAGTTVALALPAGSYSLRATAPATLNGIAGTATAHASVTIGSSGNLATRLALGVPSTAKVTASLVGPRESNVTAGSSVTFSFTVRDSGNVPVTVHPVGSPSFWKFNFTIANVTLSPGGASVSGEVEISVPVGTEVAHPPVAITFALTNGTQVGSVAPAPRVLVASYTGLTIDRSGVHKVQIGAFRAEVPFYLRNTGNVPENIQVALSNSATLKAHGWGYAFGPVSNASNVESLSPGENKTYYLNLSFSGTVFVAPGSVTIVASVLNATHAPTGSVTIPVPITKVTVSSTGGRSVTVTGPKIGSSSTYLEEWELLALALIPAGALVALIVARRWWTTRRWSRW